MTLAAIRASLASQSVGLGDVVPKVYHGRGLPNSVETTHLPGRLLLVGGGQSSSGGEGAFVAMGKLTQVVFQITDLFLLHPLAQGYGRAHAEPLLELYVDNYLAMLRNWRDAGQNQAHVTGFKADAGTVNYPQGSDKWYWGVPCVVQVQEFYTGA
jgi:hypothetical protein